MIKPKESKGLLTREQVLHLAKLVDISLSEEEIIKYTKQLSAFLEHVEKLRQLNVGAVSATSHSTGLRNVTFKDGEENKRGYKSLAHLNITTDRDQAYFIVKRVLETNN